MRTNRTLKTDWMRKIRFADEYKIEIVMFCVDGETTLNIFLDIDGENVDNECIMCIDEEIDVPTPEMKRKFNQVSKYFKQHFENVNAIEKNCSSLRRLDNMEKFNKEVNQMIDEYGYEAAYEYCKGKFNHYSYKNDDKNAGKYHKYIEIFRKLGMKEYKVKWSGGWTSIYYSMVTYKADCFIGNGDTSGKVIETIA